jgi:23S rRNA (adenine2503-C2)-methyltransferase
MICLQAVTPAELQGEIPQLTLEEARKVVGAVHRLDELPGTVRMVRRKGMDAVRAAGDVPRLMLRSVQPSSVDPFVKYALLTADGHVLETVRIPLERAGRFSVCVSSQVGCGFACAFCATGKMGLRRNLEVWEMVEQVRAVRRGLDRPGGQRVHGIVFQGMGEPLANVGNVIRAVRVLCDPCAQAIDARTVTVCTAGIPDGIRRLGRELPKVRLGISIGSARPEVRRALMPIDRAHSLDAVLDAAAEHATLTGLASMWALTLLAGVNDTVEDARALAACARQFLSRTGLRPQIRLIPYNSVAADGMDPFSRPDGVREAEFRSVTRAEGFTAHMRYSGGADVQAACGQLAARL